MAIDLCLNQLITSDCRLMFSVRARQRLVSSVLCVRLIKFTFLYLIPIVLAGFFVCFQRQGRSFPCGSTLYVHTFRFRRPPAGFFALSSPPAAPRSPCGCRRRCTGFPSASPCPGLDSLQVAVLFLCPGRTLHRCRPHSRKSLSDKVFLLLSLAERPSSLHERCPNAVLPAVVPVVGSGITGVSSDFLRVNSEQPLVHLQAVYQPRTLAEGVG